MKKRNRMDRKNIKMSILSKVKKREESVSCVIFNEGRDRVLLIKRRDIPVWVLPGGGIEQGEDPEQACARETLEETGLVCAIKKKVALYQPANRLTRVTHFFECQRLSGMLKTGDETKEIQFFPLNALPKKLVPFYKLWIQDALEHQGPLIKKTIEKTSYFTFVKYLVTHPLLVIRFLLTRLGIHLNS